MLSDRIKNNLYERCEIKPGSRIVVGVSGGPDSICLLDILSKLNYEIIVAHLNHNLRPEAATEEKFVKNQTVMRKLKFISNSIEVRELAKVSGKGIEEMARSARYNFLFKTALERSAAAVVTAHHADDQVETVMMNLIRGAGLDGLTGMDYLAFSEFSDKIPLVRPMLDTWRNEIINYCSENQLEYMTDTSNRDIRYKRNRIRHELIPFMEDYNPNIKQTILRMSDILQIDKQYLDNISEHKFTEMVEEGEKGKVLMRLESFQKTAPSIQRRILKNVFGKYFRDQLEIDLNMIETTRKYLMREIESTSGIIKASIAILIGSENAWILSLSKMDQIKYWPVIVEEKTFPVKGGKYRINENLLLEITVLPVEEVANEYTENPEVFTGYMDLDAIGKEIRIRSAKSGDRFAPLGMQGKTMNLSDFWINNKVPRMVRKTWPVVSSGKMIMWLPGFMPSHYSSITEKTETVVILRLTREQ